jgi:RND family efflux transporter MFP subunit
MSLEALYGNSPPLERRARPARRAPIPAWVPIVLLLLGFLLVLALVVGERLLPAPVVEVTPAILYEREVTGAATTPDQSSEQEMLFQASGWIEPEPYPTHVTALQSGVIARVHVLEGDVVSAGRLLVELVDEDLNIRAVKARSALQQAEGELRAAQAVLARRRDDLARLQRLSIRSVADQDVARARFDAAEQEAMVAAATGARDLARAELAEIELALSRTKIFAPTSGRVLSLRAAPGQKVLLEMDDPFSATVATLYDPKRLQARVDVPLAQAAGLTVGQRVEVVTEFLPERTFAGKVTRIVGEADLQRNTLQAKVRLLATDDRLRPEMLCRAKFFAPKLPPQTPGSHQAAALSIMVPRSALSGEDDVLVVSADGRLQWREIQPGRFQREGWIEIQDGVAPGERVVLTPSARMKPGQRVNSRLVEDPRS